jgi:predicted nucleotidyltransferase
MLGTSTEEYWTKVNTVEEIKERTISILRAFHVVKASLFGSFAKHLENEHSDVDILVWFDTETMKKLGYFDVIHLQDSLEACLQRSVDILLYEELDTLKKQILMDQIVLFDDTGFE